MRTRQKAKKLMRLTMVAAVVILLSACATKTKVEYVDREVVKYETKIQHDTLYNDVHDSIYHTIFQKGDTVYNTKYVEHIKWKERIVCKIDTLFRDSVSIQIKENTVEKKIIPNWCYYSLVVWIILIIFAVIKVYKWTR